MKALTFLIVCLASVVLADDFKTIDGKEYKNATVSRVEPDGIVITFSGGIVKVPFTELSPEIQKKYGYDSQAAADFQKQSYEAGLARAREISAANEKRQQDLASVATPLPAASTPAERQPISTSLRYGALDRNVGSKTGTTSRWHCSFARQTNKTVAPRPWFPDLRLMERIDGWS